MEYEGKSLHIFYVRTCRISLACIKMLHCFAQGNTCTSLYPLGGHHSSPRCGSKEEVSNSVPEIDSRLSS